MKNTQRITILLLCLIFLILLFIPIGAQENHTTQAQRSDFNYQYFLPYFRHLEMPLPSTSYYITTTDTAYMYELGCKLGTRDRTTDGTQDSVVVLDYSYPICFANGSFGAEYFGAGPASLHQVSLSTKYFATGYYNCTGSDSTSNLVIGVGTNNKPYSCTTPTRATAHGEAWSAMVSEINQWMINQGIFHQVQAYGASDIELGWNNPTWTKAWIGGFERVEENFFLHFGDASGCPYEDQPSYSCGTSEFPEWTIEDVWYVSWGAPSALPLPLIYLTSGVHAKQWAYLSQYSVAAHGYPMRFTGVFTQWDYCQQFSWCGNTDNNPAQAYKQFSYELNKHPETAQSLRWKTDIHWILPEEVGSAVSTYEPLMGSTRQSAILNEIYVLNNALRTQSLGPDAQTLVEQKLARYQTMAEKIELSKIKPAPKLDD